MLAGFQSRDQDRNERHAVDLLHWVQVAWQLRIWKDRLRNLDDLLLEFGPFHPIGVLAFQRQQSFELFLCLELLVVLVF